MLEGKEEHIKIANAGEVPAFFRPAFEKHFPNPIFEEHLQAEFLTFSLQGVIDCYSVSGPVASVVDWKLFSIPENADQLKTYCLLLLQKYPELQFFTCFYVSLKGEFFKRYSFSREDIEDYLNDLAKIADTIAETKEFLPKPSQNCAFCHFVKDCYEENQITEEIFQIQSLEQARELARKVYIAEAFLDRVKKLLKEYMLNEGLEEIVFDDERVYLSPSIALRFGKANGKRKK